jgi:hypothetical protein
VANSNSGKILISLIKEKFEKTSDFTKAVRLEFGSGFDLEKYKSIFSLESWKGCSKYIKVFARVLEKTVEEMQSLCNVNEKKPPAQNVYNLPTKNNDGQESRQKAEEILLTIKKIKDDGTPVKGMVFEVMTRKSELSMHEEKNGTWLIQVSNEDAGLLAEMRMTEAEKEVLRKSRRINFVLIVD